MEAALSILLGIGLSAACGFRVFVPFFIAGIAAGLGYIPLSDGFEWIGTTPAIILFGTATAAEIAAFYIPWVDNLLDSVATPAAVVAGIAAAASVITDVPPLLRWSIALIGGGGAAGAIQGATAVLRMASTVLTGGIGNSVVATGEWIASFVTALLAVVLPVAAVLVAAFVILAGWRVSRQLSRRRAQHLHPQQGGRQ